MLCMAPVAPIVSELPQQLRTSSHSVSLAPRGDPGRARPAAQNAKPPPHHRPRTHAAVRAGSEEKAPRAGTCGAPGTRSLAEDLVRDAAYATRKARSSASSGARRSSRTGTRPSASTTARTSTDLLRAEGVDRLRRGKDQRAREESGELSPAPTGLVRSNKTSRAP
jgi:hypothetical protein